MTPPRARLIGALVNQRRRSRVSEDLRWLGFWSLRIAQWTPATRSEDPVSGQLQTCRPPKCEHVANADIFYFDLTCDIISDPEVNKIRLLVATLEGLSNAV